MDDLNNLSGLAEWRTINSRETAEATAPYDLNDHEMDAWKGIDRDEDENFDPVYASRAKAEMLHRVQGQHDLHNPFHDDNYYRWDDVATDPETLPRAAPERQGGEAQ